MKLLSFDKMASVEGGAPCPGNTYCPLARLVFKTYQLTGSFFARYAAVALRQVLCTPCSPPG